MLEREIYKIKDKGIVYKVTNKINGKSYIGVTIQTFAKRYRNNITKRTHNEHLRNSILKYDIENFDFEILVSNIYDVELLLDIEKLYIAHYDSFHSGYNKNEGGKGGDSWIYLTEEEKKARSKKTSTTMKENGSTKGEKNGNYGKTGKTWSLNDENKSNISDSKKGDKHPISKRVKAILNDGTILTFGSVAQASQHFNKDCRKWVTGQYKSYTKYGIAEICYISHEEYENLKNQSLLVA